jgi:P4 family phage/plasmid primase-like protien
VFNVSGGGPRVNGELLEKLIGKVSAVDRTKLQVRHGSDVEIARLVRTNLLKIFKQCVCADGALWVWAETHWVPLPEFVVSHAIFPFDGVAIGMSDSVIKLSKHKIESIAHSVAELLMKPSFFEDPPRGINCASGFIEFSPEGTPTLRAHAPEFKQRHVLPGAWNPEADGIPPEGSLLHKFLHGIFKEDPNAQEKANLLQEIGGVVAAGYATKLRQPKAVIFHGPLADNGKSAALDLYRGVLPLEACVSITPSKVGQDYHAPRLVGKLLNASDEASSAEAIASEKFKSVVTGEPVDGRPIYGHPVEFRPYAQHVFALNQLPTFRGGIDRGVRRRLLVVPFNRIIPEDEKVEGLGQLIATKESDLLLAWVVRGAARVIERRCFPEPTECRDALREWLLSADPVQGWLEDCCEVVEHTPKLRTRDAFAAFKVWALQEGFNTKYFPTPSTFTSRVLAWGRPKGLMHNRTGGAHFYGLKVRAELLEQAERLAEGMVERLGSVVYQEAEWAAKKAIRAECYRTDENGRVTPVM